MQLSHGVLKNGSKFDAKINVKKTEKRWKMGCEITLILEGHFSWILVATCLHFGTQVEAQKHYSPQFRFKISARGFREAPRASRECPRAPQEWPKSAPRASQSVQNAFKWCTGQLQERPKVAKTGKPRWHPTKTQENLKKTSKMDENVKIAKSCQYGFKKHICKANDFGREFSLPLTSTLKNNCCSSSATSVLQMK